MTIVRLRDVRMTLSSILLVATVAIALCAPADAQAPVPGAASPAGKSGSTGNHQDQQLIRQWASEASATSEYGSEGFSAMQATGKPDTSQCGDSDTAWASADKTGQDSLTLIFDHQVRPTELNIYQTYAPGAITGVELVPADGGANIAVPDSTDPDTTCPHVFTLTLDPQNTPPVDRVIIHLDQTITEDWNEIDAVELVGYPVQADQGLFSQWASAASATSQYGETDWSAQQATGEPNTRGCGDTQTAWASQDSDGKDSLTLTFDQPVKPAQINVYQTYNPGSITSIDLIASEDGRAIPVPNSADPVTTCPHVFRLRLSGDMPPVSGVVVHLDQAIGGGWNEIDAVELQGYPAPGFVPPEREWASSATASSQYEDDNWSAKQAIGKPNTIGCGDQQTAWASAEATGNDTLQVGFQTALIPQEIDVYQTYNPGSITSIELLAAQGGRKIAVPNSADPDTTCPHVFRLKVSADTPINGVIIHLDQSIGGSWNEIDAVQLVGRKP